MQRIDLFGFYRLGQYVHPATELRKRTLTVSIIGGADQFLNLMAKPPQEPLPLKLSAVAAFEALEAHSDLGTRYGPRILAMDSGGAPDDFLFDAAVRRAEGAVRDFEAVLEKELLTAPTYFVSPKGAYDTALLIDHAEAAIGPSALSVMPEDAIRDFREAGRCLALEVPTACGYHVMRCVESVLRKWHSLLVKSPEAAGEKQRAPLVWGKIEKELRDVGASKGTIGILTQIRELHRNPIMHPEVFLSMEEAMILFDISKSAIEAMAREISKKR